MPLSGPTHIPPIGEQTDPDKVRVAVVIGGQLASAPARGFGLTAGELTAIEGIATGQLADMSIGFKTAGNRFVVNDKADLTGTDVMTVSEAGSVSIAGTLTATGSVVATTTQFIGGPTLAVLGLASGGAGSVLLRPNGYNNNTGETSINSAGGLTAAGRITSSQEFISASTATVIGGTGGGGTIYLRPDSSVGAGSQFTVNATGMGMPGTFSATGVTYGSAYNAGANMWSASAVGTSSAALWRFFNANGQVGAITVSASATAYATSSDENLKDFIGPYDPLAAIEIIRADPVRDFRWKADGSYAVGWGAQTSYNVSQDLAVPPVPRSPEEAQEEGAGTDPKEPGYIPWGMDHGKRTPYLWAALTHALDRIDALEARILALENK